MEIFDLYIFILFQVFIAVSTFFLTNKSFLLHLFLFQLIITKLKFRNTAIAYYMAIHLRSAYSFAAFAASLYLYVYIYIYIFIRVKMPIIVGVLIFMNRNNSI